MFADVKTDSIPSSADLWDPGWLSISSGQAEVEGVRIIAAMTVNTSSIINIWWQPWQGQWWPDPHKYYLHIMTLWVNIKEQNTSLKIQLTNFKITLILFLNKRISCCLCNWILFWISILHFKYYFNNRIIKHTIMYWLHFTASWWAPRAVITHWWFS